MNGISVYVHIPFCQQKCYYCDFNSFAGKRELFEPYVNSLVEEIENCNELYGRTIDTIFIGGGTPSVLPPSYIAQIMEALGKYNISKTAEITIESNPNSLPPDKLAVYKQSGINRLSIGLQAMQTGLLKRLGRLHSASEFIECYENALRVGFENISTDLMFAIPEQDLDDWEQSLKALIELKLKHISCYSLIIEEGTPFSDDYDKGRLCPIDDETDRQMYYLAVDMLGANGYKQYEISNFALPAFESNHNIAYWKRADYIGFGLSAHSLFDNKRFENTACLDEYIKHSGNSAKIRQNINQLSQKDQIEEFMFLGLRMTDGISRKEFAKQFGVDLEKVYGDILKAQANSGLLLLDGNMVKLTKKGVDLSNAVFSEFLLD